MYQVAEKFKSLQGEGVYAGTPMAFIRFVGCSVGKKICQHCDTDFETTLPWQGGGKFTARELFEWSRPYDHICLTGGEPFDQDLDALLDAFQHWHDPNGTGYKVVPPMIHVESSGTKMYPVRPASEKSMWMCISPKPGFQEEVVTAADEIKVIVPGLGTDQSLIELKELVKKNGRSFHPLAYDSKEFRWPSLQDALRWAKMGKTVFLQPRNGKFDINSNNLRYVQDLLVEHPNLRLSLQLHKLLRVQ